MIAQSFVFVLCFLTGLALLRIGMRGRRVGVERRCGRCDYRLVGIVSIHCPECGERITGDGIAYGRRRVWVSIVVAGGALVCASLIWTALSAFSVLRTKLSVYPYVSFAWVLSDAAAGEDAAVRELQARVDDKRIPAVHEAELAEVCLRKEAETPRDPHTGEWLRILDLLDTRGVLSAAQRARYREQAVLCKFEARSPIRQGDPLPVRVCIEARAGGGSTLFGVLSDGKVLAGERQLATLDTARARELRDVGRVAQDLCLDSSRLEPGRHKLIFAADRKLFDSEPDDWLTATPDWTRRLCASASVDVLARDAEDPIHAAIEQCREPISVVAKLRAGAGRYSEPYCITLKISRRDGLCVSCDAFIRSGGREFRCGEILLGHADGPDSRIQLSGDLPHHLADEVELVLRGNPEPARNSLDIFEIWSGEAAFPVSWRRPSLLSGCDQRP